MFPSILLGMACSCSENFSEGGYLSHASSALTALVGKQYGGRGLP